MAKELSPGAQAEIGGLEASVILNVSVGTIRNIVIAGLLKPVRYTPRGWARFSRFDVEALAAKGRVR